MAVNYDETHAREVILRLPFCPYVVVPRRITEPTLSHAKKKAHELDDSAYLDTSFTPFFNPRCPPRLFRLRLNTNLITVGGWTRSRPPFGFFRSFSSCTVTSQRRVNEPSANRIRSEIYVTCQWKAFSRNLSCFSLSHLFHPAGASFTAWFPMGTRVPSEPVVPSFPNK